MPRVPLSLSAYFAYCRSTLPSESIELDLPPRDPGPLVWMHGDSPYQARALRSLASRLRMLRPEVQVHITQGSPDSQSLPLETPGACADFVERLRPDVGLWAGSVWAPSLLWQLSEAGTYLLAVDVPDEGWSTLAPRWLPDATIATLSLFDRVHAVSDLGIRRLRRLGLSGDRIQRSGGLQDTVLPLDCAIEVHEEMAAVLSGRPVWLAAHVRADEAEDVLRAQIHAVRLAHRLMLVLAAADIKDAAKIRQIAEAHPELRLCYWDLGEVPDENTQVVLVEDTSELGLWYRLSPIVFMGSSLVSGHGGRSPYEAAALGAAILYGPNVGGHLQAYSKFVDAGAARIVRDASSLAAAVSHVVAPDQAAAMAHAGWDVVSSGAQLVDGIIADICDRLDAPEVA